jgi:hypothetical protein
MVDASRQALIDVLREARSLLARPNNDFTWSSWENAEEALEELDRIIAIIEEEHLPPRLDVAVLFAPTGPIQEVSLSSGWAWEFLALSQRFDVVEEAVYAYP